MTKTKLILAMILGLILTAVASGWYLSRRWYDPLFGLEEFPVATYLHDYRPIKNKDFQCRWKYLDEAWRQEGLRVVTFESQEAAWPVAVALPDALTNDLELERGKTFAMKVTVEKDGLIYAKLCR